MVTMILNSNRTNAKQLSGSEQFLGETGPRALSLRSIFTFYHEY